MERTWDFLFWGEMDGAQIALENFADHTHFYLTHLDFQIIFVSMLWNLTTSKSGHQQILKGFSICVKIR